MDKKRNWSSFEDFNGKEDYLRYKYTRDQWTDQFLDWTEGDRDRQQKRKYLMSLDDEDLMELIADTMNIDIRETTWLEAGERCFWSETGGTYRIREIRLDGAPLQNDTAIVLTDCYGNEAVAPFCECYGYADWKCPHCGSTLLLSDTATFRYVCECCNTNFS